MRKKLFAVVLISASAFTVVKADAPQPASLTSPRSNGTIDCSRHSDGVYRCAVSGTAQLGAHDDARVLLWMKPVRPAADGWYLQRGSVNGIQSIGKGGVWNAVAQLGNAVSLPAKGHVVAVAVTITPRAEAVKLLSAEGVVVRSAPLGTFTDEVTNVSVHLR